MARLVKTIRLSIRIYLVFIFLIAFYWNVVYGFDYDVIKFYIRPEDDDSEEYMDIKPNSEDGGFKSKLGSWWGIKTVEWSCSQWQLHHEMGGTYTISLLSFINI